MVFKVEVRDMSGRVGDMREQEVGEVGVVSAKEKMIFINSEN
jgi:hypothetical protein